MAGGPRPYPVRWEADVVLRDGAPVHVRPIRPDDDGRLNALHNRLSAETVYFRFFSPLTRLPPKLLDRLVNVDYRDRMALVALLGDEVVAVARYERLHGPGGTGDDAEVAFVVDDAHQGRGLGTLLLEHLAVIAREEGIARFVADTLPENSRMLRVFHEAGFGDERRFADGVVRVVFPIEPTEASLAAAEDRDRHAASRSVHRLLHPRSVAVVGANRARGAVGRLLLDRLLSSEFDGTVYPVNSAASHVAGVRAYASVLDIPDPVDLAVIAVPAAAVGAIVEQCAQKHVSGLVVIAAGFAEGGPEGLDRERELVVEARRHGMRLIGPNSMGVLNTDAAVRLNATFSQMPAAGRLGFVAQSGGLGLVILDEVARRGFGLSTFVSLGNKGDVSSNDVLQYWEDDEATDVCLMYIEAFGNPRVFARVAPRVARHKPIVAVKSGRSVAGARAAGTDVPAEDDRLVDALFLQTGVIRTDTMEELFDVAQLLDTQPLPAGSGVAIVGNAGGSSVLAADACAAAGLDVVAVGPETQARVAAAAGALAGNPVSLAPDAPLEAFAQAIAAVLDDNAVSSVIAIYTSPVATSMDQVTAAIVSGRAAQPGKPVVACVLGRRGLIPGPERPGGSTARSGVPGPERPRGSSGVPGPERPRGSSGVPGPERPGGSTARSGVPAPERPGGSTARSGVPAPEQAIPSYAFPEAAARALGHVCRYAEWRRRPPGRLPELTGIDLDAATELVASAMDPPVAAGTWMPPRQVAALLGAYGIRVVPWETASSARQATEAAARLGYPVAVKKPTLPGQVGPERGAFRLNVPNAAGVRVAFEELSGGDGSGVYVQAMTESGEHVVAGVVHNAVFGPLVTLGLGGRLGEPAHAVTGRVTPVTDIDAEELVEAALGPAVPGGQPWPEAARAAVTDVVLRVSRLADDLPELTELELNPVIASPSGAVVVGARARVAPWEPRPELALRRLS